MSSASNSRPAWYTARASCRYVGHLERVPGDQHRPRMLRLPETEEHRPEPEEHVPRATVGAAERLRNRVVGAVRERVAVDDEQRSHASDASSSAMARCSRSVAICAASAGASPPRSSRSSAGPYRTRERREPGDAVGSRDPRRDERYAGLERDPSGARVPASLVLLAQALLASCALREHDDRVPFAAEGDCRRDRLLVPFSATHRKRTPGGDDLPEREPEELGLRHETQEPPRKERNSERPGVEVRRVVRREHQTTLSRDVLGAVGAMAKHGLQHRPAETLRRRSRTSLAEAACATRASIAGFAHGGPLH